MAATVACFRCLLQEAHSGMLPAGSQVFPEVALGATSGRRCSGPTFLLTNAFGRVPPSSWDAESPLFVAPAVCWVDPGHRHLARAARRGRHLWLRCLARGSWPERRNVTKVRKFDAGGPDGRPGMSAYVTDKSKLNDPRTGNWTEDLTFDEAAALRKDPKLASTFEAARSRGVVLVIQKVTGKQGRGNSSRRSRLQASSGGGWWDGRCRCRHYCRY
jgi:hypothetical protein